MNVPSSRRRSDRGFTLIELLIALVLSGVVTGAISAAMITSLNVAKSTTAEVNDSADAGQISSYLQRDALYLGGDCDQSLQFVGNQGVFKVDLHHFRKCRVAVKMVCRNRLMRRLTVQTIIPIRHMSSDQFTIGSRQGPRLMQEHLALLVELDK